MKSTIIPLFSFLILFFSCKQEVNEQDTLKTFVIEGFDEKELRADEYFSEVRLLPLQLDTNQFIGKAKDVCIVGDTIFLLDEMTASIYTFDKKDGKCIAVICTRGNGPNEYINPVALSANSGNIFMLSDMFIPSFFYKSQRHYGFISLSDKVRVAGIVKDEHYHIPFYPQWQQGNELTGMCPYESEQEQPTLVFYTR